MVVIGEIQVVRDAQGIGFIDSQTQHGREEQAPCGKDSNDQERGAIRGRFDCGVAGLRV